MIRFIHKLTGTEMQVADDRKDEYLAAGHKLAAEPCAEPAPDKPVAAPKTAIKSAPKKTTGRAKK